ncbi:TetR/AcrR family transcriptional regulator [Cellulosimicrobium arenosum]|uniref:TetR/AcrR family transcriptional regulator C-terminal domain-containing protein n=1 Tax=Cellulosimicrobium arenosum TaxID=2708133 RepID=A0A927IZR4_9MICO|nr:TetR/AcrR family transcriptional regulator [Cellulosimicrobium arenosum]MBD8078984.1 TetR/AcrR family transcriptional regulator C-terminal domain-containing protein [Cellulosimicrobium arenosum]
MSDVSELPHRLALAWGVAERPERAPKRELSIERIVEAAVEIADTDGLAAVSMAKVAQSLGFTTMSLYRYVTSKDDLLLLMQEAVLDVEYPPAHDPADWRAELREWVQFTMELFRAHTWYLSIPVTGAPFTPNNLRAADAGLRALRSTPLDEEEKMSVILLTSGYTKSAVQLEADLARAEHSPDGVPDEAAVVAALRTLVDDVRFPNLYPLVDSGAYGGEGQIDDTAWGLERILDGLESYVGVRAAGAPGAGRDVRSEQDPGGTEPDEEADDAGHDQVSAHARDPRVKRAALQRRDAERRLREAQKSVRELERSLRDARRAERDAVRAAVEKSRD